ncbi:PfaD family polyunsaturated fatty acid/polyketide biosynthesis protein [Methylogaea oryzae]|uniref:[Acyl-carrier-protein] S-malonyltransferase-like inserted helical domain-containing protein n=1 Tax=Methylogaea oryzae TaxID=1295382 RepID=A0A8D5AHB7_9GAMM|nr:PfaD family polyunsaturated fatty acid/polyketide biosynthesis protein [Methylogaea oryzae]BBL71308.1 hypothetical protein MoryE10_19140 [Methylogaea oryzae]
MDIRPERLGSPAFRAAHGVRAAYVIGGMVKGISSVEMVRAAGNAGYLAFFGAGGLRPAAVNEAVAQLSADLGPARPWGVNFLHNPLIPAQEDALAELLLASGVRCIEASAFVRITPALVRYRLSGLEFDGQGRPLPRRRIIAKVSHPDMARRFMEPPPADLVADLRARGLLTAREADAAGEVPLADDVCAEADSGGHTDRRPSFALIPAFLRLRDETARAQPRLPPVRIGAAGGIGAPEAVAAAFVLGADFVLTGSINQCTPEAGTSEAVKDMLAAAQPQDFDMAPAGDLFEIGAKVQVLKRGSLFAARANRLYELYRANAALDDIPAPLLADLEAKTFGRRLDDVWRETEAYYRQAAPEELADIGPKKRMAMIFRWYFIHSQRLAQQGDTAQRVNFQIHCGPAMAACNRWLADTPWADWRQRHVDRLADRLLEGAAQVLAQRYAGLNAD